MNNPNLPRDEFGNVTIADLGRTQVKVRQAEPVSVDHFEVTWRPPDHLRQAMPRNFEITFNCYLDSNGIRHFVPQGGYEFYIRQAFTAGFAGHCHDHPIDAERRQSYRHMFLIFQLVRAMRDHLGRKFACSRDLHVQAAGRNEANGRSLLPSFVGKDSAGRGRKWSVAELTKRGREAASLAGFSNPTSKIAIQFGFLEAARRKPLFIGSDEEVQQLLRMALFTLDSMVPDPEYLAIVTERLLLKIFPREREPIELFNKRFFPGKSNLIKALANQPKEHGGSLPMQQVREAVMYLGWQSYFCVAGPIGVFGHYFCRSLPQPLSPEELRHFNGLYMPQGYLGGLPLLLLKERADIIGRAIADIWDSPGEPEQIAVLYRLLHIYSEMATNRRAADRRFKHKAPGAGPAPREVTSPSLAHLLTGATANTSSSTSSLARRIAEKKKLECVHCVEWKFGEIVPSANAAAGAIDVELICGCGRTSKVVTWPPKQRRETG